MPMQGTVVVTGAARGIGYACALHLAQRGLRVFAGVRSLQDGEALCQAAPELIRPVLLDVTSATQIQASVARVMAETEAGEVIGLINNAGISVPAPLEFIPLAAFREQMEVNVTGQLAITQAFLPLLRQSRGRIVMMSSVGAHIVGPFLGAYHAAKFALEGLSQVLRLELAPFGITVIIIEPSMIATPMWTTAVQTHDALLLQMPPAITTWYGPGIDAARAQAAQVARHGLPASKVAQVVARAVLDPHPKQRYTVR